MGVDPSAGYRWNCARNATKNQNPIANRTGNWGVWPPGVDSEAVGADSEAFVLVFAEHYFNVVHAAIKRYDQNHLLLGMRGGCFGFPPMLKLFASYVDVYDLHSYADVEDKGELLRQYEEVHNITGLPIIHGEFSYTAIDSGVPVSTPAILPVLVRYIGLFLTNCL